MTKVLLNSLIAASVLIFILQAATQTNDAKKIKIKLKDLKKAKKYAYLLASQRKKLYAIPFPVPLPVFVKRQHIYTQIPVVPRYVQQPSYYGHHESAYDPYTAMSGYMQESMQPPPVSHYPRKTVASIGKPSKYLAQLANAFGQAYPTLGSTGGYHVGSQRDVVSKLLSGQAKVLSPGALISSLKSSPKKEHDSGKSSSADNSTSVAKTTKEPGDKSSASEIRLRSLPRPINYGAELYETPALGTLLPHAFMPAYLPAAQATGAFVPHPMLYPMMHPQRLTPALLQQLTAESHAIEPPGGSLADQVQEQQQQQQQQQQQTMPELQEVAASSTSFRTVEYPRDNREHPEQLIEAMRHRQALHIALAREREEARVAESNAIALHAHQLGLPVLPNHLRLLDY